jgi:hypothetical protein
MIKINNDNIDIILQAEDYANINDIINLLSLDVYEILIISTETLLQRFIQFMHENITDEALSSLEEQLNYNKDYIDIILQYKGKEFRFHFIILSTENRVVNNPFKGDEIYKVALKKINI